SVAAPDPPVSPQQQTDVVPPIQRTGRSQRQLTDRRSRQSPAITPHTDVLISDGVVPQRMPPPRERRQRRGGFSLWRFFWMAIVLAAVGAGLGRCLADSPQIRTIRPTPAPVVTAVPTQPPARPTVAPTVPPPTQQPVVQPTARPTTPPTATAGPPSLTPVPPTP